MEGVINKQKMERKGAQGGETILDFRAVLKKRMEITHNRVMPKPPEEAKAVMREIYRLSAEVVVPGHVGVDILNKAYDLRPEKVRVIPHGVPDVPFISSERPKKKLGFSRRFVLGSFGLLHPAKGIEFVLEALPKVIADNAAINVLYLIVGETHPNVVKNEGESYRARLKELIANLDLEPVS